MSVARRSEHDSLPVSPAWRLDPLCQRFESAWRSGQRPRIEEYLTEVPEADRPVLLYALLRRELACRRESGETPSAEEYQRRFPAQVHVIDKVFRGGEATPCSLDGESSQPGSVTGPERPGGDEEPMPARLGRYHVLTQLGKGGFGVVYKGYDDDLRREVAIKVPHRHRFASPRDADAYLAEARLLARLDHPGIVRVHDFGRMDDGRCYLVSQFIAGHDLQQRLAECRPLPGESVELIVSVAETLHHAHQHGLTHRDIKPANILLDSAGKPVVADFGLALREEDFGTGPHFAGTPAYMSPEQARGEGHRVDARTDVYSLGVVFYELLTGQPPFMGTTVGDILEQVRAREPRPPRQFNDKIPRELERVCMKAMAKRAADRYSTALDLAEDLRHWQAAGKSAVSAQAQAPQQAVHVNQLVMPATPPLPGPQLGGEGSGVRMPDSDRPAVQIVPKGLRSFDVGDADFFLHLLPGPRDRDGLPDSIRFWKARIEETDADQTFGVGLLYGPSGCGKSSLIKAGLLPRLAGHVVTVYVEATPDETELRLLRGLRKRCPGLGDTLTPAESLAALRRGRVLPAGQKVLIVFDQFEQWLHARAEEHDTALMRALRQCDGQHVQCLLLVRDDFWMAATRFLHDLEVRLIEGQNSAAVDLFSVKHARRVLAEFGRAFGCLPPAPDAPTPEQEQFLEQTAQGLAQEGKVVPVRLSLFAEMVKSRTWAPETLRAVGGAEGVGVAFLEETFSTATAPPEHRYHQRAARAVLRAMLPERRTNLRGHIHARDELLRLSGYVRRPGDFDDLMRILDTELRLVTPSDPEGLSIDETCEGEAPAEPRLAAPGKKYYQLTHDYLVPALRQWLTRKQRETARGRAELVLEQRAALWGERRERRQLPTWWEWLRISLLTRRKDWTEPQRQMMRRATRDHLLRTTIFVGLLLTGLFFAGRERQKRNNDRAEVLVSQLLGMQTAKVPSLWPDMAGYERWMAPRLLKIFENETGKDSERLHAALALARTQRDEKVVEYLYKKLLSMEPAEPDEFLVVRDALYGEQDRFAAEVNARLRTELVSEESKRQVRAAVVLLQKGQTTKPWEWLREKEDPTRRTFQLHEMPRLGTDIELVARQLQAKSNNQARRALILSLGEYDEAQLNEAQRDDVVGVLLGLYAGDPDPGIHSAAEWTLRKWQRTKELQDAEAGSPGQPTMERSWFVNTQGQTFAVLRDPGVFSMGSPLNEAGRSDIERLHQRQITRSFAIATKEVTVGQFFRFLNARPGPLADALRHRNRGRHESDPVIGASWFDAIGYCRWLSEEEKLTSCYPPLEEIRTAGSLVPNGLSEGVVLPADYLSLDGYRLPTEAEWEFACRAGTTTSWSFGDNREMLPRYALYVRNADHVQPVGRLKPNDFGLFDMHGNVAEHVNSLADDDYPYQSDGPPVIDREQPGLGQRIVKNRPAFVGYRGGSFNSSALTTRSAFRSQNRLTQVDGTIGFRIARTIPTPK